MSIPIAHAAATAYANAAKSAGPGIAARDEGGSGFAELLKQAGGGALGARARGEAASIKAVSGKADIADVVTAVTNAEVSLQTVTAVRDRVIQAYQDILRMPI
jgi:flagellar hook-basal body complex protein FliE